MSEEILKALTQLFAIITKQDGGVTERERQFVINFFQTELDQDSIKEYVDLYDEFSGMEKKKMLRNQNLPPLRILSRHSVSVKRSTRH